MWHLRVAGSIVGAALFAGACASTGGMQEYSQHSDAASTSAPQVSEAVLRDSAIAQEVADREGPGATVSAEIISTAGGSRRVRAHFHLDSDAYVVVGHVDADGIVRIVFPASPTDDGLVTGNKTYGTSEFLAGFTDEYRVRASELSLVGNSAASHDSYDGGIGYVFIIASWRPMRFERFTTDNSTWDSYEVASSDYLRDPRPAVQELASLLAGDNREAYTVQYARYYNTVAYASPFGDYDSGYGYCLGSSPFGFASSPFQNLYNPYGAFNRYGENFSYRGLQYSYNADGDCYTAGYGFPGYGYQSGFGYGLGGYISQGPGTSPPTPLRGFIAGARPPHPLPVPMHRFPYNAFGTSAAAPTGTTVAHFSPEYRQRGLITSEDPATSPVGTSRLATRPEVNEHSRPSIQQMTAGRTVNSHEDVTNSRARSSDGSMRSGWTQQQQQQAQARARSDANGSSNGSGAQQRGYQHAAGSNDGARSGGSERSAPPPRQETHSAPPPTASSGGASSAPRSAPPPAASSSSSSSSSSGKPPAK